MILIGRMEQLVVVERAIGPRDVFEALVGGAERGRKRAEIDFLGDGVRTNEG